MMVRLQGLWWHLTHQDDGATMPEYGLMVALIAAVALVGAELIGANVLAKFNEVAGKIL